jgi:hypothetical protein
MSAGRLEPVSGSLDARSPTAAVYETEERRLVMRGGEMDGRRWVGVIGVGHRVAIGPGPWSSGRVYIVTDVQVHDEEGHVENIAVPAPF